MSRIPWIILVVPILLVAARGAAGAPPHTFVLAATEQTDRGRTAFLNSCAKCHGQQGQGGDGPRIIGSPNGLPEFKTAQGLFDYVSTQMPQNNPGTLTAEEYWDIVAFVLDSNKLLPPDTVLGPNNAGGIRLTP